MNGNAFDKLLSAATMAGIAGLLILNWRGTNELLKTISSATTGYVKTVQGR